MTADLAARVDALTSDALPEGITHAVIRPARICDCARAYAEKKRVRCADYCDWRFIADTWLAAGRSDHRWRNSPAQVYFSIWRDWIHELIRRKDVTIAIVSDPQRNHRILGWICYSPAPPLPVPVVHFLLVRGEVRKQGVMWDLLREAGITRTSRIAYTCAPKSARWLAPKFASATHLPMQEFLSPK